MGTLPVAHTGMLPVVVTVSANSIPGVFMEKDDDGIWGWPGMEIVFTCRRNRNNRQHFPVFGNFFPLERKWMVFFF